MIAEDETMWRENAAVEAEAEAVTEEFVDELKPGTQLMLGQYTIEEFLASGGFGITYLARDSLNRRIVIKECFPGNFCRRQNASVAARSRAHQNDLKSIVRLFSREAESLSKADHPNIVRVHQVFEENSTAYMALDYVDGRDLLEILTDTPEVLNPEKVETYLMKMLDAIGHVHRQGILHRDISPDNIIVNELDEPVLIDFGAAREQTNEKASRLLSALRVVKDGYSPQEFYIAGSEQEPSCDLYSLAASFYHIITGELPPDSQRRLTNYASGDKDPYVPLSEVTTEYSLNFTSALDKAMSILPKDRMQSAEDWAAAIKGEAIKPRRKSSAVAVAAATVEAAKKKQSLMPLLVASTALVVIGAGIFFVANQQSGTPEVIDTPTAAAPAGIELPTTPVDQAAVPAPTPAPVPEAPAAAPVESATAEPAPTVEPAPVESVATPAPTVIETPAPEVVVTAPTPAPEPEAPAAVETPLEQVATDRAPAESTPEVLAPALSNIAPDAATEAPAGIASAPATVETPSVGDADANVRRVTPGGLASLRSDADSAPTFIAAPPSPPAPQTPDMIEVASDWSVSLPFTARADEPNIVGDVTVNIWAWLKDGTEITAVNGIIIDDIAKIPMILRGTTQLGENTQLNVRLATSEGERQLILPIQYDTTLSNGVVLESRLRSDGWQTKVASVEAGAATELRPGDTVVSFGREPINGRETLAEILTRETESGERELPLNVLRDGSELTVKTVTLGAPAESPDAALAEEVENQFATSSVAVDNVAHLPFTLSNEAVVDTIGSDAPFWLSPGAKIVAINETPVSSATQFANEIEYLLESSNGDDLNIKLSIVETEGAAAVDQRLKVFNETRTTLLNGLVFNSRRNGSRWETRVTAAPSDSTFQEGDQLVAFMGTGERMEDHMSLKDILDRELDAGTTRFSFAVLRSGAMWIEAFSLAALEN